MKRQSADRSALASLVRDVGVSHLFKRPKKQRDGERHERQLPKPSGGTGVSLTAPPRKNV